MLKADLIANTSACTQDQYTSLKVMSHGRYRLRIVNLSGFTAFTFKINGIKLYIVELDGTTYEPAPVDVLTVGEF